MLRCSDRAMTADDYHRPERFAEFAAAREAAKRIRELGGCGACLHRNRSVSVFGRSICARVTGAAFPNCLDTEVAFEPDREVLGL